MKLLYCMACEDVFALVEMPRSCRCGKSAGHYTDRVRAVYSGPSAVLGFRNGSFTKALTTPVLDPGKGIEFTAFVIPASSPEIERVEIKKRMNET